jgi:hypothetical protein
VRWVAICSRCGGGRGVQVETEACRWRRRRAGDGHCTDPLGFACRGGEREGGGRLAVHLEVCNQSVLI